jgi:hypothetical protein
MLQCVKERALVVVARGGVEPPTFRFSVGRSYQLSYLAWVALPTQERESTLPERSTGPETGAGPGSSTLLFRRRTTRRRMLTVAQT